MRRFVIVFLALAASVGTAVAVLLLASSDNATTAVAGHDHAASTELLDLPITQTHYWSQPETWGGKPPKAGADVTIPAGVAVILDESPPPLKTLKIYGALLFARRDLTLTLDAIELYGALEIGTTAEPFAQKARIVFMGARKSDGSPAAAKGISVLGGDLELHGQPLEPSWTRLAETAKASAIQLMLEQPVRWRTGDQIVIASTELDPYQAEERTIARVEGNRVSLTESLKFDHRAERVVVGDMEMEQRAEVGLLTRSIVLEGGQVAETDGLGGYTMYMPDSVVHISWTELYHMGQKGVLARYPVHFHVAGDVSGSYVRDSSIHHSFNRCFTIHGTHGVIGERNVAFDAIGHCYFFEDGIEAGNVLEDNLGILTRAPEAQYALLESDLTPATYWISNPDNTLRGNVAAGSDARGFWFDPPLHPTGLSKSAVTDWTAWPRRTPLREFSGNVAHSNKDVALLVGSPDSELGPVRYTPKLRPIPSPAGSDAEPVVARFERFVSYRNKTPVRFIGDNLELVDPVLDQGKAGRPD